MGANEYFAFQATPADILHGLPAGIVKMGLHMSLSVLLAVSEHQYLNVFAELQTRMANMPRFPSAPGFATTKFSSGVTDFVNTPSHRQSLKGNGNTLQCGLGLHSQAFVTMLLHLAFALLSDSSFIPSFVGDYNPIGVVVEVIFCIISMYMDIRRKK